MGSADSLGSWASDTRSAVYATYNISKPAVLNVLLNETPRGGLIHLLDLLGFYQKGNHNCGEGPTDI